MAKRAEKPMPSQEVLLSLLHYNPENGVLSWRERPREMFSSERIFKAWNTKNSGKEAFIIRGPFGHRYGSIFGSRFYSHRIIWKMVNGRDPVGVDHIDGDPGNNRLANLREADQKTNMRNACRLKNNTTGHTGVYWFKDRQKWFAAIKVAGRHKNLGYFDDIAGAIAARKKAEAEYGFHPNHGRRTSNG